MDPRKNGRVSMSERKRQRECERGREILVEKIRENRKEGEILEETIRKRVSECGRDRERQFQGEKGSD